LITHVFDLVKLFASINTHHVIYTSYLRSTIYHFDNIAVKD